MAAFLFGTTGAPEAPTLEQEEDARTWLEEVEGDAQLAWVKAKNDDVLSVLGNPEQQPLYGRILSILDSKEKIPYIGRVFTTKVGGTAYYNFWQDEANVRGVWRRCPLDEYRKAKPAWETVLDLDVLSKEEGVTWVWGGSTVLDEGEGVIVDRVILKLSRGGADAKVAREFDLDAKTFVPEADGGFVLPEAKSSVCFLDRDTLLVGGSFWGAAELTDSGYPRTCHQLQRGAKLADAPLVYEGKPEDVSVNAYAYLDRGERYEFRQRALTFYTTHYEMRIGAKGAFTVVPVPEDVELGTFADQLLITLRKEWLGFAPGTMLAASAKAVLSAKAGDDETIKGLLTPLFVPTESCSLEGSSETRHYVVLSVLDHVRSELRLWRYRQGSWALEETVRGENFASLSASGVQADVTDDLWLTSSSYTQPTTYSLASAARPKALEEIKALPTMYDAVGVEVQQYEATSLDGTKVPYFAVTKAGLPKDGSTPCLLYGYGGFEISLTPGYIATVGVGWLEKGFSYVQANIRGGGEFGPKWHQAALKANRNKAYEDFEAVARDLVARGITSHAKLGCQGGSNGGLLVGNMLARSPELWGAVLCQVPLLDMKRYSHLLAGASWMGEFGNPDVPDEWAFLRHNSPYHTLQVGKAAPPTLFTTSTRDDRVHPAHARKLAGKMTDLKMPALSYENIEGGHGGAADNKQRAFMTTLAWTFLERALAPSAAADAQAFRERIVDQSNGDGGRRRRSLLRRIAAAGPVPAWLPLALGSVLILAAAAAERARTSRR